MKAGLILEYRKPVPTGKVEGKTRFVKVRYCQGKCASMYKAKLSWVCRCFPCVGGASGRMSMFGFAMLFSEMVCLEMISGFLGFEI